METYIKNKDGLKTHLLYKGEMCKLHHPIGWREIEYSTYLGPFTNSKGKNYDLGVFIDDSYDFLEISDATVFSNEIPYYTSGCMLDVHNAIINNSDINVSGVWKKAKEHYKKREAFWECYQRCLELGVFNNQ